jgi:hypothetical protein
MLLTLALTGSVNAMAPAWSELQTTIRDLGLEVQGSKLTFYNLDIHKNTFDYFSFLTLSPFGKFPASDEENHSKENKRRFEGRHLLYPLLFAASACTSYEAMQKAIGHDAVQDHLFFYSYALGAFALQITYSFRPLCRWACRFLGVLTAHVSD